MAKVEYCDKCGWIKQQCTCEEPITNADKIRSMTDEELVQIILCPHDMNREYCCKRKTCYDCCLEWLQSEVKDINE